MSKSTRFDMFFLAKLNTYLLEKSFIKSNLKFFSNNSIYEVYDKYRYVEYYYKNKVRYHKVSEVDKNSHLALIIVNSLNGASINELAHSILDKGISIEEATSFINLLIENQFLISEFDFTLTGEDYFSSIINMLVEKKHLKDVIKDCQLSFSEITEDHKTDYDQIFNREKDWLNNVEEKTFRLSENVRADIEYVISKLKEEGYKFKESDTDKLSLFISQINGIIRIANRINNFKEGTT